jgi:5-methyltetrahydrofolate--homocysteine methyltransferase
MNPIQELLQTNSVLVLDGAMGTMLMAAGLTSGAPPEEWNVLYPERVRAVHRQYIEAGSNIILTNSFGGTHYRLKLHNLQDRVIELNRAAAAIARAEADVAVHRVLVAGSMGPTGELLEPMGEMRYAEAVAAFAEQARGLVAGGVDLLWIETMSDLQEVQAAVEGIRSTTGLPICATMSFDTRGRTMMGVTPAQAVRELSQLGLAAVGGNCGNGIAEIEGVIANMHREAPDVLLIAKANAGIPQWINNKLIYDATPADMGQYAWRSRALGASLIGGCCGNTPAHVQAIAEALRNPLTAGQLNGLSAVTTTMNGNGSNGNGTEPTERRRVRRREAGR